MMNKLYDTHCHLFDERYDNTQQVVLEAKLAGVEYINNIGTDLFTSQIAVKQANKYENVFALIGVHPNDAHMIDNIRDLDLLRTLYLENKGKVIGFGEIGLDFYYEGYNREIQEKVFKRQLEFAKEFDLVVNIHCRKAYNELHKIMKDMKITKAVIHCFTEDYETAQMFLDLGYYISIPGVVTFKNTEKLAEAIKKIPLNKLLIETDAGYLTPVPFRGKLNYPKYLVYTANKIAEIRGMSFEDIAKATTANAKKVFLNE